MIVDELVAVLGYDIRNQEALKTWQLSLDKAAAVAGRFASNVADAVGRASAAVAVTAKTAIAGLGTSVIATGAEFERYQTQLETLEGSADAAKASMAWLSDFAVKTPYELTETVQAFVKLKSYGIDAMDGMLSAAGDWAAGMGKSLDQVVEAIADARTGEMERLKELGLRGSSDTKAGTFTFTWSENGQEFKQTVKQTAGDVDAFLRDYASRRFGGAMDKLANTWEGRVSKLGDAWQQFKRMIADAGFFDEASKRLGELGETIDELFDNGTAQRWANELSAALTEMAQQVGVVMQRLRMHFKFLDENRERFAAWYAAAKPFLLFLMARAFPVATALAAVALALDDVLTYLQGGESFIGSFIAELERLTGVSTGVAEALTATLGAALAAFVVSGGLKASAIAIGRMLLVGMFSWAGAAAFIAEAIGRWLFGISLFDEGLRLGRTLVDGIVKAITENDLIKRIWNAPREALEGIFNPETPEQVRQRIEGQRSTGDWFERNLVEQFGPTDTWLWGLGARHKQPGQQPTPVPASSTADTASPQMRVTVEGPDAPPAVAIEWPAADAITTGMRDLATGLQGAADALRSQSQQGQAGSAGQPGAPGIPGTPGTSPAAAPAPQSAVPSSALGELATAMQTLGASAGGWASANKEALTSFSANADKTQPPQAVEQVSNDNSTHTDNRQWPVTINQSNQNTVNVQQVAQAVPAIGQGIAAAGRSAASAVPARMQSGPTM